MSVANHLPISLALSGLHASISVQSQKTRRDNEPLPWVGSYFGIPQPDNFQPFTGKTGSEVEIHILKKNLSVRHMVLRHTGKDAPFLHSDIVIQLQNMAYIDDDAIAFMLYDFTVDKTTGERKQLFKYTPHMRVDRNKWCRLKRKDDAYTLGEEYTPEVYKYRG